MGWEDLLKKPDEKITLPFVGNREITAYSRTFYIKGRLPAEYGWYRFHLDTKTLRLEGAAEPEDKIFTRAVTGYLVGDRFVDDKALIDPRPEKIAEQTEAVYLIEDGLDRFTRVRAAKTWEDGPLLYVSQEMPLGGEQEVLQRFLDNDLSLRDVKHVCPALEAAFRMEMYQRAEAQKRREEAERLRLAEEARLAEENRRKEIIEKTGDAQKRRELAKVDFAEAARAALAVSGAEYLDDRKGRMHNERVVRFRLDRRRFECTCDGVNLRVIDSGICLHDHVTDIKYDDRLFLETLPGVIREAIQTHKLVVYRHVD